MFTNFNLIILGATFLLNRLDYISGGLWILIWLAVLAIERFIILLKEKEGLVPLAKTIWLEEDE